MNDFAVLLVSDPETREIAVLLNIHATDVCLAGHEHGSMWFADYAGDRIGMFDTKQERFKEWKVPTAWSAPYDAAIDRNGQVWSVNMANDRLLRLDPATGKTTEFPLPHQTNVRRLLVDNSSNPPRIWIGNNHHASIIEIQPLD